MAMFDKCMRWGGGSKKGCDFLPGATKTFERATMMGKRKKRR